MKPPQKTLGIITNLPHEVFQRDVIEGARQTAQAHGCAVKIFTVNNLPQDFDALLQAVPSLAGALVIANILNDSQLETLHQSGLPLSLVSHFVPALPIPCIVPNNRQGVTMLMQHLLIDCERTRPAFIRGDMRQNDAIQRAAIVEQEMMRCHLRLLPENIIDGEFLPAVAAERFDAYLKTEPHFDSVIASDYLMAIAALEALSAHGYRVPEEIAVVGFGDGAEAQAVGLTTVAADIVSLGQQAARQLLGQIDGLHIEGITMMSTHLVVRSTTCR
jgi:DNA-binding LacI/PurR family transcriptional regulator